MFNNYPYTDLHELNLDWILRKIKELNTAWDDFKAVNNITWAGVWDITENYPAWSIVNAGSNGYVSIKPVPAGVDISNTDYWKLIADYSSLYADFEARLIACEKELAKGFDNSGKWLFLGDSYDFSGGGWIDGVIQRLNLGSNGFNQAVSGHGFYNGDWENDFRAFCAGRSDLTEFKHVVVGGGLNDALPAALSPLAANITSFCNAVKSFMPNAHITLAYFGNAINDAADLAGRDAPNRATALNTYKQSASDNGASYITNIEYVMHNISFFNADHIHPNSSGAYRIINAMVNGIITGSCDVTYNIIQGGTVPFVSGNLTCYEGTESYINNGVSIIKLKACIDAYRQYTFTLGNSWTDLGEIPSSIMQSQSTVLSTRMQVSTSSATNIYDIEAYILNRHLMIRTSQLNGYSGGYAGENVTNKRLDLFLSFITNTLFDC